MMNRHFLGLILISFLVMGCLGDGSAPVKKGRPLTDPVGPEETSTTVTQPPVTAPVESRTLPGTVSPPTLETTPPPTTTQRPPTPSPPDPVEPPPETSPPVEPPRPKPVAHDLDIIFKRDSTPKPTWLVDDFKGPAPWDGSVYIATSGDGQNFGEERLFVDRAGVPNLHLGGDGTLVATFQYFSFSDEELFDVIAYTTSEDYGETWSGVSRIYFEGLPRIGPGGPNPVDPTLVGLEDGSYRFYFTYHAPGGRFPGLYSAVSPGLDIPFQSEGPQLVSERMILDPAVVYFNGLWHHYTVLHGENRGGRHVNVHSTSNDGRGFALEEDIPFDFQFLGQVIEDDGLLRFYGSGRGVESAYSYDGYKWTKDTGRRVDGADPGVVKLPDGSYLMVYTKLPEKP